MPARLERPPWASSTGKRGWFGASGHHRRCRTLGGEVERASVVVNGRGPSFLCLGLTCDIRATKRAFGSDSVIIVHTRNTAAIMNHAWLVRLNRTSAYRVWSALIAECSEFMHPGAHSSRPGAAPQTRPQIQARPASRGNRSHDVAVCSLREVPRRVTVKENKAEVDLDQERWIDSSCGKLAFHSPL